MIDGNDVGEIAETLGDAFKDALARDQERRKCFGLAPGCYIYASRGAPSK